MGLPSEFIQSLDEQTSTEGNAETNLICFSLLMHPALIPSTRHNLHEVIGTLVR